MNRFIVAIAAGLAVSACSGGNPFEEDTDDGTETETTIPEAISRDVDSISYDADSQTLIVRGQSLDNTPYEATYTRAAALDRNGYEAYTSQEGSLGRHHTAYVREIDGARAAVVMAGGQFDHLFSGADYGRTGPYTAPDVSQEGGIVHYAGSYVGLVNGPGDGSDLNPVADGTPDAVLPSQAAEVTGQVFITADFADNVVDGVIYDRDLPDYPTVEPQNLNLGVGSIAENGTFDGTVYVGANNNVGEYGGIFSGQDASAVAGAIYASEHIEGVTNEYEQGIFVLGQCGTANDDPVCDQPLP
ncbi:thymidylate synthase [Marinibacterium sp. SX1]|uniref:thymidylate synthase n=1 Tax=Marinibacterium sp. SX1 TaxID=3388424 RepID=UPI003D17EE45